MSKHSRLSNIFKLMKQRCYDANRKDFCNYGARGITVCDEWNDRTLVANIGTRGRCSKGYLAFKEWALCNGYIDGKVNYILKLLTRKEFSLFQPVYQWKEIVLPELKENE